jgi:hypothetical protein
MRLENETGFTLKVKVIRPSRERDFEIENHSQLTIGVDFDKVEISRSDWADPIYNMRINGGICITSLNDGSVLNAFHTDYADVVKIDIHGIDFHSTK